MPPIAFDFDLLLELFKKKKKTFHKNKLKKRANTTCLIFRIIQFVIFGMKIFELKHLNLCMKTLECKHLNCDLKWCLDICNMNKAFERVF